MIPPIQQIIIYKCRYCDDIGCAFCISQYPVEYLELKAIVGIRNTNPTMAAILENMP